VADQQGFNIHYATGWYLNFGLAGIILGALIVVGIWGWLLRTVQRLARTGSRFAVHWNCTLCFCLGFTPALMRNGPEGLKGLIVEAIAVPLLVALVGVGVRGSLQSRPVAIRA